MQSLSSQALSPVEADSTIDIASLGLEARKPDPYSAMRRIEKHFWSALKHLDGARGRALARKPVVDDIGESFATAVEDEERARWEGLQYDAVLKTVSGWLSA